MTRPEADPPAPEGTARLLREREEAVAALQLSEERLRTAVDAGQVGIWDWDIAGNRITWSDRVYEMHGIAPGTDPGGVENWRRTVHPDDLPRVQAALQEALATGAPYVAEFRRVLPDGSIRWTHTRAHVARDAAGQPRRLVGATIDITERMELLAAERRARGEAEASRRRMELLAAAGEQLAGSLDPQETLLAVARTLVPDVADWCRIDLLDDAGQPRREIAYHVDAALAERALQVARELEARPGTVGTMSWVMRTGRPHHGDFAQVTAQTDPAIHRYTTMFGMREHFIIPLVARGRTIGGMAVVQAESGRTLGEEDRALILELGRRAALALANARLFAQAEAARAQAESANRAKDEFLAVLGHELRNPLAPIVTALEVMQRRWPQAGGEQRQVIRRQVNHLSRLIDDLLDVSRITRGKIDLRREPVELQAIVANAIELTRPVFERHREPVVAELPRAPLVVQGDFVRLSQVVANLLVNAGKFTPPDGRVRVALSAEGRHAVLQVQDTGCGIPADLLPRVFDLFVQGRQPIDRSHGGLGIGLAIVRSLAQLHGGSVAASSEGEGRGAVFTIRLPLDPQAESAPAPLEPLGGSAGSGRILLVDDNADAAQTLGELLDVIGYEVRTAGDADEALEVLQDFRPQLALLDIGLPRIDGYQLARMLRERPDAQGIKLVALTGYGQDSDRARSRQAGFDEHLVKPVDIDQLLAAIKRLLG